MFGLGKKKNKKDHKGKEKTLIGDSSEKELAEAKKEDPSIPRVPHFDLNDYDENVSEEYSVAYVELGLSKELNEAGMQTVLNFLNSSDEEKDDYVKKAHGGKEGKWELGSGKNTLMTENSILLFQRTPLERSEFGVFKSVQTMVTFLSNSLSVGVNDIDAVEFFPNPESKRSHIMFINKNARLDREFIGNKEDVLKAKSS